MKLLPTIMFLLIASRLSYSITAESANIGIDFTLNPSINTSTAFLGITSIINPLARNDTKGYLIYEVAPVPPTGTTAPGGGVPGQAVTLYYDIIVSVRKDSYPRDSIIIADIIIINKRDASDRDSILTYYLYNIATNTTYGISTEILEEVLPLCNNGKWNETSQICYDSTHFFPPNIYRLQKNITLPPHAVYGEWRFVIEYETPVQPLIIVYDRFQVISNNYLTFILIAVAVYAFYKYTKSQTQHPNQKIYKQV